MERQAVQERNLTSQDLERSLPPFTSETEDDLLNPSLTKHLRHVSIANDAAGQVEFRRRDLIRIFRRPDNRDDGVAVHQIFRSEILIEATNSASDIKVVVTHHARVIEVMEHRRDEQVPHLALSELVTVIHAGEIAHRRDMEHVPEVVVRALQVLCLSEEDSEIGSQVPFVEVFVVPDDLRQRSVGGFKVRHQLSPAGV